MTCVAPVLESSRFVSARIVGAVFACSARKPPCTQTDDGMPGKRLVSGWSIRISTSVRSDRLHAGIREGVRGRETGSNEPCARGREEKEHVQLRGVRALVRDDDRVLRWPITDVVCAIDALGRIGCRNSQKGLHSCTSLPFPPVSVTWKPETLLHASASRKSQIPGLDVDADADARRVRAQGHSPPHFHPETELDGQYAARANSVYGASAFSWDVESVVTLRP